ncbi:ADP-ribosyl-[dinitrogen reductase] hydrolase [Thiorhodospira sibirica]|uniref:ADP-ribosyl-[dinitrogen reductase] hydrolase n=1 Tax=Thiorhodospira sibirica TaxID=154347 RepID=UPI00022C0BCF|nr:ADP-ribosyl-[dinitrogen reductase] hydrolase [Thiorhodospira sibirica]
MPPASIESRALGAYLGLALGDALGATVEFMMPREIQAEYGVHSQIRGGGWLHLKPGQVTDDTTMALALGQALLSAGALDATAMAEAFSDWLRAKPVDVGHTVRRGIVHYRNTGHTQMPYSDNDAGNGACMRVLPVALATLEADTAFVRHACQVQAHITHHHALSDAACETVSLMVQASLRGLNDINTLLGMAQKLVALHPEFNFRRRRSDNPSGYIVHTLQTVFQGLFDTESFEQCLIEVVNRGGDADTTGAIAGMIAGAFYGLEGIPGAWLKKLDPRIRAEIERQTPALLMLNLQSAELYPASQDTD